MTYDGVIIKPDLDEAIEHYGVLGMKWGIRRDLRNQGYVSNRTKRKITKALNNASYNKHRRMLNALAGLEADQKGRKISWKVANKRSNSAYTAKEKKNSLLYKLNKKAGDSGLNRANTALKDVSSIYSEAKKSANKKGYTYKTKDYNKMVDDGHTGVVKAKLADKAYRKKYNGQDSPYYVRTKKYKRK